jgi:hypothetical protein
MDEMDRLQQVGLAPVAAPTTRTSSACRPSPLSHRTFFLTPSQRPSTHLCMYNTRLSNQRLSTHLWNIQCIAHT